MITVVFSTYNGADTLSATLQSMQDLDDPDGGWKLIAVDNASTDKTADILKSFSSKLPMQTLYQPRRGKNACLNMAIPYFEGDLVIFTDDDVIPMQNWLVAYIKLAEQHPEISVFGGSIIPHWPGKVPESLLVSIPLGPAFAVHPEDLQEGPVSPHMIWGPNMAIRKQIFDDGYQFNENIGPNIGNYIMGSETELLLRLNDAGYLNWYTKDIIVKHQILKHQFSPRWIFGRAVRFGKKRCAAAMQERQDQTNVVRVFGLPRCQVWRLIKDISLIPIKLMKKDQADFLEIIWRIGLNSVSIRNEIKLKWKI